MLDGEDAPMSNYRGRFSYKSVYYRDDDGVQRKIQGLILKVDNEKKLLVKVYTLLPFSPDDEQEIILELKQP